MVPTFGKLKTEDRFWLMIGASGPTTHYSEHMITKPDEVVGLLLSNAAHFIESSIKSLPPELIEPGDNWMNNLSAPKISARESENLSQQDGGDTLDSTKKESADHRNALIFVAAGVELLLKTRLALIHWSQIFSDPGAARIESLKKQSFESLGASKLCDRIERLTGDSSIDKKTATDVFDDRNATIHFHPPAGNAVEIKTLRGMNFSIDLLAKHLIPHLKDDDLSIASELLRLLQDQATSITGLRDKRLATFKDQLKARYATKCPNCLQPAVILIQPKMGESFSCLFCFEEFDRHLFAQIYADAFPSSSYDPHDPPMNEVAECPECSSENLLLEAFLINHKEIERFCFSCNHDATEDTFEACSNCIRTYPVLHEDDWGLCADCTVQQRAFIAKQ